MDQPPEFVICHWSLVICHLQEIADLSAIILCPDGVD
jgi:hypothetical protein